MRFRNCIWLGIWGVKGINGIYGGIAYKERAGSNSLLKLFETERLMPCIRTLTYRTFRLEGQHEDSRPTRGSSQSDMVRVHDRCMQRAWTSIFIVAWSQFRSTLTSVLWESRCVYLWGEDAPSSRAAASPGEILKNAGGVRKDIIRGMFYGHCKFSFDHFEHPV